ncbi:FkbM family methyltransferase [Streptomyces solicathayae]|uniref:FkbM family methyltransferase n=1 Tax=Streptomyces solicathayae TaxID=3081768 RepID=A0ABZ0LYT5_9ACTN|nr:FkbM family methyltransferase [Streptomyces sp. HUAS YS2]WOX24682.1 FkbM family methyltransferase [Streptomyces sp. HUAS YS2]
MDLRQRAAMAVIRTGRQWLGRTQVARWPLAGAVVRQIVHLGYGSRPTRTAFRDLELTVPPSGSSITAGLLGGYYETIELDLFERLCAESRTVVDVGANLGVYSCLAARRLPPGGRVVAFEPVPENRALLRENVERNAARGAGEAGVDVVVEPLAVGAAAGTAVLRLARDCGQHFVTVDGSRGVPVRQVALDDHLPGLLGDGPDRSPVDVLKVDTEGYEGHVLRGARRILAEDRPTLLVEYCRDTLTRAGFRVEEFADLLAEVYDTIHVVDATAACVRTGAPRDLLTRPYGNRLFNIAAAARPEHAAVLAAWAARHTGRPRHAARHTRPLVPATEDTR